VSDPAHSSGGVPGVSGGMIAAQHPTGPARLIAPELPADRPAGSTALRLYDVCGTGHAAAGEAAPAGAPRRFEIPEELLARVDEAIARYPSRMAAVLPALHLVQRTFGWVPVEAQEWVAERIGVPAAHVHGCVSFYTLFRTRPMGRHHLQVCRTLSCELRGSNEILAHLKTRLGIAEGQVTPDGRFSLVAVECLGSCGTAPTVQINDDYHENLTVEALDRVLEGLK